MVSIILVHYFFKFVNDLTFNLLSELFVDRVKDVNIPTADFFSGVGEPVTALRAGKDTDWAKIEVVIQDEAGKSYQPVLRFNGYDLDFS